MISNELTGINAFLGLHCYCVAIILILLPTTVIYNRRRKKGTNRYIVSVYLFFFLLILSDCLLTIFHSKGIGGGDLQCFLTTVSYLAYSFAGFSWFLYCESEMGTILYNDKLIVALLSVPIIIIAVLEISLQSQNMLIYLVVLINMFYLLLSLLHTIYYAVTQADDLVKTEYIIIAIVSGIFIITCVIACFFGSSYLCIGASSGIAVHYQTITAGLNRRAEKRAKEREAFLKSDNEFLALAVGTVYNMVFSVNLTQNRYHLLGHDGQMAVQIPLDGVHDDLIRRGMQNIPYKEDREYFYEVLYRENQIAAYKKGKRNLKLRYREMGADGAAHWIETIVIFMKESEDIVQITFVKNIDEEIKKEAAASDAKRLADNAGKNKKDFVSSMSHDIRTPINSIIGMTEIAKLQMDDSDRVKDCLAKIDIASQHLFMLANDFFEMNDIENGSVQLKKTSMNLIDFADDCVKAVQGQIIGKQIEFNSSIGIENPQVFGDEVHLKQAVLNIINNSVRTLDGGGKITFSVREVSCGNDKVRIKMTVSDSVDRSQTEYIRKIWDPFSRENSTLRTNFAGTGLDMAIARHYIELMQGAVYCDCEQETGSSFTIDVSFEIDNGKSITKEDNNYKNLAGIHTLLVEDNELNLEIARTLLEDLGMIVNTASDGSKAIDDFSASEEGYYDLILMDIMMPVMDGLSATRAIRNLKRNDARSVVIIAITANDFDVDVQKSLDAGMNAHLNKPIDVEKLKHAISELI